MSYEQEAFNSMTTDGWRWRAPELMSGPALERVTKASDVYAFAMTVIEVCFYHLSHKRSDAKKLSQITSGQVPFSHIRNDASVVYAVVSGGRPKRQHCPQVNDDIWAILEKCWDADPDKRPSIGILLRFIESQAATFPSPQRSRLASIRL
jgi:serine/threonine protein kinase